MKMRGEARRSGLWTILLLVLSRAVTAGGGTDVFPQLGHSNAVHAAGFSPDGRLLASAGEDSGIILWDVSTHRAIRTFRGTANGVDSVAFSPDGLTLASGGGDGVVRLWDIASGEQVRTFTGHAGQINSVSFSPGGDILASAADDHSIILWSSQRGVALRKLGGHHGAVRSIAFSPDGTTLASGGVDKLVYLWDVTTGQQQRALTGHADLVSSVAFCPGGLLASASWDHTVKLWDFTSGREVRTLTGQGSQLWSVACAKDGSVAAASYDHTVARWDGTSGRLIHTYRAHTSWVESVAYSPDGTLLASASADHKVILWNLANGLPEVLSGSASFVKAVALSPDGQTIAAASTDQVIRLWNGSDGHLRQVVSGLPSWIDCLEYSPDGMLLAAAGGDGTVRVWDMHAGHPLYSIAQAHASGGSSSIAFSPDGAVIATGTADRKLKLWDSATGHELRSFVGHAGVVQAVTFSADGRFLASADERGVIKLWDALTGAQVRTLSGHTGWVASVAFSRDGRELASGGADRIVRLWDVATGSLLRSFAGHTQAVDALVFAPNGRQLASASWDNSIRIWDPSGAAEPKILKRHSDQVSSIAFSGNGNLLVSASLDATVRVWDPADGVELARLIAFNDGSSVEITPQGYYDYRGERAEGHLNVRTGDRVSDISAYRETFYRPDLLRRSLDRQKLPDNLDSIDKVKPAPGVALVNVPVESNAETLNLNLRLNDRGGGVGDVRVFVNDTAVNQAPARDLAVASAAGYQTRILPVRLVAGRNDIEVYAFNSDLSVHSESVHAVVMARYTPQGKPRLYALVVGIERYANPTFNLHYAVADATAVGEALKSGASPLFQSVNIDVLTKPEETTKTALIGAFQRYRSMVGPNDVFVFYVASHGVVGGADLQARQYYLIPSSWSATTEAALGSDALGAGELRELIGKIPAARKLILLDTCASGALGEALSSTNVDANVISTAMGITVLSASTSDETAEEGEEGHGLFTWVLLQGLGGKADIRETGTVNTTDLGGYVESEVPKIARSEFHHEQHPDLEKHGQAFQIVSSR